MYKNCSLRGTGTAVQYQRLIPSLINLPVQYFFSHNVLK